MKRSTSSLPLRVGARQGTHPSEKLIHVGLRSLLELHGYPSLRIRLMDRLHGLRRDRILDLVLLSIRLSFRLLLFGRFLRQAIMFSPFAFLACAR